MHRPDGEVVPSGAKPRRIGECRVEICHASMVPDFDMFGLPLKERNHGSDYPTRRQHRAFGQYRG